MNARLRPTLILVVLVVTATGCATRVKDDEPKKTRSPGVVTVYAVNYPLKYFAERIGGDHIEVVFPAPADEDPAFWIPDADTITAYQEADLILLNGASYAKWTKTISLPSSRLCDTSITFADDYIQMQDSITHSHGPGGKHAHSGMAFTTWIDPRLALRQAQAIGKRLAELRPEHADAFRDNLDALESDLKELDERLTDAVEGGSERAVFFSHPVFQYLQRRGKLNGKSVHWEPDTSPSQESWEAFQNALKDHPAKWMIWEAPPSQENVKRLADLGVQSTVFAPCGNVPPRGDFLDAMNNNIENLSRALMD